MEVLMRALSLKGVPQLIVSREPFAQRAMVTTRSHAKLAAVEKPVAAAEQVLAQESRARRPPVSSEFVAPTNDLERLIAEIWEENLGITGIGVRDDFFELGGESLVMMGITARVAEVLNVEVPLRTFLRSGTTVAAFSETVIARLTKGQDSSVLRRQLEAIEGSGPSEG
jgi:hypothetical protein